MKKKPYVQAQTKVVEVEDVEIICTSGGYNNGSLRINGGNDITLDEDEF